MRLIRKILGHTMLLMIIGTTVPSGPVFALSTNSSPIALTNDDKFVLVVNPNVEVIEPVKTIQSPCSKWVAIGIKR